MREAGAFQQVLGRVARGMPGARPMKLKRPRLTPGRQEEIVANREIAEQQDM